MPEDTSAPATPDPATPEPATPNPTPDTTRHTVVGPTADETIGSAPDVTSKPYPPEADPEPRESTRPAQVPGEQTDPTRRS